MVWFRSGDLRVEETGLFLSIVGFKVSGLGFMLYKGNLSYHSRDLHAVFAKKMLSLFWERSSSYHSRGP